MFIVLKGALRPEAQPLPCYHGSLAKVCTLFERRALSTLFYFLNTFILEISNYILEFI